MIHVIMKMAREKGTVDDTGSVNTVARTQEVKEGLMNPSANFITHDAGTFHYSIPPLTNVNPKIYPPLLALMPPEGVYIYPYMPPPIIPNPLITQMDGSSTTIFTQSLPLQAQKN